MICQRLSHLRRTVDEAPLPLQKPQQEALVELESLQKCRQEQEPQQGQQDQGGVRTPPLGFRLLGPTAASAHLHASVGSPELHIKYRHDWSMYK